MIHLNIQSEIKRTTHYNQTMIKLQKCVTSSESKLKQHIYYTPTEEIFTHQTISLGVIG